MTHLVRRLIHEDSGQDIIEYALVSAGIAVLLIPAVPLLGQALIGVYTRIGNTVGALAP
jgi:Flp pilus assembly pilin Flp